jgi:dTDP-4-amino-4,6-dideoxygalactose transaminase
MTTGGEGGMVTTNDDALWRFMWSFKDHGKSYAAVYEKEHPPGFRWLHESFGTNWRMIEMQAVLGRIQLRRMSEWTKLRTHNAKVIHNALKQFSSEGGPIRPPNFGCSSNCIERSTVDQICGMACTHAYYKYYAYVRPKNLAQGWSRDRIIEAINKKGIPCYQGSCSEVYLEKAFDGTGWRPSTRLNNAKDLGETSLMFLVHPTLTNQEMQDSARVISEVLAEATQSLSI